MSYVQKNYKDCRELTWVSCHALIEIEGGANHLLQKSNKLNLMSFSVKHSFLWGEDPRSWADCLYSLWLLENQSFRVILRICILCFDVKVCGNLTWWCDVVRVPLGMGFTHQYQPYRWLFVDYVGLFVLLLIGCFWWEPLSTFIFETLFKFFSFALLQFCIFSLPKGGRYQ